MSDPAGLDKHKRVERVRALQAWGFTERQARFLVLVLEHSGVWLPRQYWAFSGIAHGRETHQFPATLIAGGSATTDLAAPAHGRPLYHLQYKPWYRLLDEPDHRHRRPMSVGRAADPSTGMPVRSRQGVGWCSTAWPCRFQILPGAARSCNPYQGATRGGGGLA